MSEQFIVEQLEILNDENDFKGEYWWAVTNTERIEDCFECRNKEVAIELCAFLNKATEDFKWQIRHSEKWSARCKQLEREVDEQQSIINLLLDLLYQSEATVIHEYSSNIGEDMDKLDRIFKEKDIKEIERFVGGCDDE